MTSGGSPQQPPQSAALPELLLPAPMPWRMRPRAASTALGVPTLYTGAGVSFVKKITQPITLHLKVRLAPGAATQQEDTCASTRLEQGAVAQRHREICGDASTLSWHSQACLCYFLKQCPPHHQMINL